MGNYCTGLMSSILDKNETSLAREGLVRESSSKRINRSSSKKLKTRATSESNDES
jgi:hypothetical protein